VISISGPSGAGKTTATKAVAARLDAATLFFDDWTDDPAGASDWLGEPDADYNRWTMPEFAAALGSLKQRKRVTIPTLSPSVGTDRSPLVEPAPFVVVEQPFGRMHDETAPLIDLAVCLDLPLHIALARRLARQVGTVSRWAENASDDAGRLVVHAGHTASLVEYLEAYQTFGHHYYENVLARLLETSDLMVDATAPPSEIAAVIENAAREAHRRAAPPDALPG
jgi:hypothetical protein